MIKSVVVLTLLVAGLAASAQTAVLVPQPKQDKHTKQQQTTPAPAPAPVPAPPPKYLPTPDEAARAAASNGASLDGIKIAYENAEAAERRAIADHHFDVVDPKERNRIEAAIAAAAAIAPAPAVAAKTPIIRDPKADCTPESVLAHCIGSLDSRLTPEERKAADKEWKEQQATAKRCDGRPIRIGSSEECVIYVFGRPDHINSDPYSEQWVYGDRLYIYISRSTNTVTFFQQEE